VPARRGARCCRAAACAANTPSEPALRRRKGRTLTAGGAGRRLRRSLDGGGRSGGELGWPVPRVTRSSDGDATSRHIHTSRIHRWSSSTVCAPAALRRRFGGDDSAARARDAAPVCFSLALNAAPELVSALQRMMLIARRPAASGAGCRRAAH
jgi:hypothetical protein